MNKIPSEIPQKYTERKSIIFFNFLFIYVEPTNVEHAGVDASEAAVDKSTKTEYMCRKI